MLLADVLRALCFVAIACGYGFGEGGYAKAAAVSFLACCGLAFAARRLIDREENAKRAFLAVLAGRTR